MNELEKLKLKIGNLIHEYYMKLPPEHTQEGYSKAMYGPDSLLEAVDKWIEVEEKRIAAREKTDEPLKVCDFCSRSEIEAGEELFVIAPVPDSDEGLSICDDCKVLYGSRGEKYGA